MQQLLVTLIRPSHIKRDAKLEELDAYWVSQLRRFANEKRSKMVCYCAEVLVLPTAGAQLASVIIRMEQDGTLSEERIYPYRKHADSGVSFDSPAVKQMEFRVFDHQVSG